MVQKAIVSMENITMSFSGNKVLDNVNFELREGEVHSLMGSNGAGKSTLIKILNGIHIPVSGTIEIDNETAHIRTPKDAEKYGLAFVHQELNVCIDMTVAENMYIGNWATTKAGLYDQKTTSKNAKRLLDMMGVDLDPDATVRRLRTAEKQIIEILKTLTRNAKVIVLDEPTSSLNEREKKTFFEIIDKLKAKGVSIIFISHFIEDVIQLSDRVTVLKDGVNNGEFVAGQFTKDELVTAMIGHKVTNTDFEELHVDKDAPITLEIQHLTSDRKFEDINLKAQVGDIVGVCGLLGAGKTEVARTIFGLDSFDSGKIIFDGKEITKPNPAVMIKNKVTLLTEERKLEGFIPLLSIRENSTLAMMKKMRKKNRTIDFNRQSAFAEDIAKKMHLKMSSIEQSVVSLSGGNQQKVVIAKCLASKPKLFLLDEPTRGVDVYAKSEIYKILREAAESGTTIIIFSSELEELLANCRQIIILKKGQISGVVDAATTTKNDLLSLIG